MSPVALRCPKPAFMATGGTGKGGLPGLKVEAGEGHWITNTCSLLEWSPSSLSSGEPSSRETVGVTEPGLGLTLSQHQGHRSRLLPALGGWGS